MGQRKSAGARVMFGILHVSMKKTQIEWHFIGPDAHIREEVHFSGTQKRVASNGGLGHLIDVTNKRLI